MADLAEAADDEDTTGALPTSAPDPATPDPAQQDDTTGNGTGSDTGGQTGGSGGEQAGPALPAEQALDTRERALDKSGLGGAFGAAQHGQIAAKRQEIVQAIVQHAMQTYGMGGPSTAGQEGSEYAGPTNDAAVPPGAMPTSEDPNIGPPAQALRSVAQGAMNTVSNAFSGYADHASRLKAFLTGDRAMDQNTAGAIVNKVNPDGSEPNESAAGLEYAHNKAGPDAALGFLQNRVRLWDLSRSFAASALDGKNLGSAVDAANRAFKALPLTESVQFAQAPGGQVTATVKSANGEDPLSYDLSVPQFRELLRGKSGIGYDILMRGPNTALSELSAQDHDLGAPPDSQGVAPGPNGPVTDDLKALGVNQAQYNLGYQLYPWASQQAQRMNYFAGQVQEQQKQTHELAVAKQQGINRENTARVTGQARTDSAAISGQSRQDVAKTTAAGHTENAKIRADAINKQTIAKLQAAREVLRSKETTAAQQIKGRELDTVLKNITVGMDPEAVDAELKKHGQSLDDLLKGPQQAPAAPTGSNPGTGAPQVAPPGAYYQKDGKYFDRNKQPL